MRKLIVPLGVLAVGLLAGCVSQRKPYEQDPLLLYYKPTLSDSATILAERQAKRGPTKPPAPADHRDADNLAERNPLPAKKADIVPVRADVPSGLLPPPPGAAPARPVESSLPVRPIAPPPPVSVLPAPVNDVPVAVDSRMYPNLPVPTTSPAPANLIPEAAPPALTVAAKPAPRRSVPGKFGHDADYRWLQGVLERHPRGFWCLRYCDPSQDDVHGGKVRLDDDARLNVFHEGDIVGVNGELSPPGADSFAANPRYRIGDIWLANAN